MQNQQYQFWTHSPEVEQQGEKQNLLIQAQPVRPAQLMTPEELNRFYEDLAPDVPY